MKGRKRPVFGGLVLALAAAGLVAASIGGAARAASPIVIGWAYDSKGQMSPFDGPALAAAQVRIKQINAKGGVDGRMLEIKTCDTQNNNPAKAKSCAAGLLDGGASVLFVTCDVEFSAPATQEAIKRGVLAVAPCIGTDQMGPKRFGTLGKLAFSFGNVAQDEGAAMAEYAYKKGWRTAAIATDNLLIYFKDVVKAFEVRFKELGGKIVAKESYTAFDKTISNVVSRLNGVEADVIAISEAFGELPALVSGLRSLGNKTPIINSWGGDGTYWNPKSPKVTNYYFVTFASAFGNDPNPAVNALVKAMTKAGHPPGTGGFVTGAAAIDGVVSSIKRAGGSTKGADLAAQMEKFKKVPTISGLVSFSATLHTVFGRQYRVMRIENNVPKYVGAVTATSPAKI
ncbi:MAG: ABC transporter substrate-binding protein [Actinobacteria bacterium]|nr:ABC transporter substrate-binding protein [Actinomycetota bacterium]